ncbi:MAG: class I SAM-dependent methyltransferase [Bacteroidota bacterium]
MNYISINLFFKKKIKSLLVKFKIHYLINPFKNIFLQLFYLGEFSEFVSKNKNLGFNDFYKSKINYEDRFQLHQFVFEKEKLSGKIIYLEFGVADGISFKYWAEKNKNKSSRFYGFDTFTGLPENYGAFKKNHFDTGGKYPQISDKRVEFFSGLFQTSLPKFLKSHKIDPKKVIHIDSDLYSSCLYVLTSLFPYLNKGDIIIFDEFGVPTFEFKAFNDFCKAYDFKFEILGAVNNYLQLAIKIK